MDGTGMYHLCCDDEREAAASHAVDSDHNRTCMVYMRYCPLRDLRRVGTERVFLLMSVRLRPVRFRARVGAARGEMSLESTNFPGMRLETKRRVGTCPGRRSESFSIPSRCLVVIGGR
jgi:hypothetical protein